MTTNNNEYNKDLGVVKKKIIISMCAIILLVLTLFGITYAYFTSKIHGNKNNTSIEITAASLKLEYDGEDSYVEITSLNPGENIDSKTFSVKNTGTATIYNYDVILENLVNELTRYEDLTYELTCKSNMSDKGNICTGASGVFPKMNQVITTNSIEPEEIHSYVLTLNYEETYTNQSIDMNKEVSARVNIKDDYSNIKTFKVFGNYSLIDSPSDSSVKIMEYLGNYNETNNKYSIPINIGDKNINILLDEPLRKLGNVSDYIDLENRIVVRKIGEKVFDGTEEFFANENGINYRLEHNHSIPSISNYYSNNLSDETHFNSTDNYQNIYFRVDQDVESFKLLLQERYNNNLPLKVLYVLSNEYFENINFSDFEINDNDNVTSCDNKTLCASDIQVEFDE